MSPRRTTTPNLTWLKAAVALAASVFVVGLIAPPVAAAPLTSVAATVATADSYYPAPQAGLIEGGGGPGGRGVCEAEEDVSGDLPVTRWSDGMSFHDRLHGYKPGDIAKNMQRQGIVSLMFGVGNTAWAVTTGTTEMAINFCVLDKVGGLVDNTAADIGDAILNSGLIALFLVITSAVYMWRVGRGTGGGMNSSALIQKALVLGLFGVMVAGASNSTGAGADRQGSAVYDPGLGSPGWFVTTIDQVVSTSASSLASSVEARSIRGAERGPTGRARLGCAPYVKAMKEIYRDKYGSGFDADASATVPLLLSSMWESSALEMWKEAQFGTQSVGTYNGQPYGFGDLMYCRMLESNVAAKRWPTSLNHDTSVSSIMAATGALQNEAFGIKIKDSGNQQDVEGTSASRWHTSGENLAWRYSTSNKYRDRQWVGWAACATPALGGGGNDPGAVLVHDEDASDTDLANNCADLFTEAGWDGGSGSGQFDWDESDDDITSTSGSADAEDFLLTLHGNRQAGGMVAGFIYMGSSLLIAAVFILLSAAIMVAKVAALVMMVAIFMILTISLLPNASMGKIVDFIKQYVGLSLFAWGAQLILSLIALFTSILINVGNQIAPGGPGGVMAVAWVGMAPVIAVFCLHFVFKKLRIPSPLKMSGGMAWGQMAASGAVGGAAGMGAGALVNRASNRVKQAGIRKGKETLGGITGKGRKHTMTPGGGDPTGTQTGAGTTTSTGAPTEAAETQDEDATAQGDGTEKTTAPGAVRPSKQVDPDSAHGHAEKAREHRKDRKDARVHARTAQGKADVDQARLNRGAGIKQHTRDRLTEIGDQFRNKPLKTSLKYGAVTMAALATGGTPLALGLAGAALVGRGGVRKTRDNLSGVQDRRDEVEAYRLHQQRQREQDRARASASAEATGDEEKAKGQPTSNGLSVPDPQARETAAGPEETRPEAPAGQAPPVQPPVTQPQSTVPETPVQVPVAPAMAGAPQVQAYMLDENGNRVGGLPTPEALERSDAERQAQYQQDLAAQQRLAEDIERLRQSRSSK